MAGGVGAVGNNGLGITALNWRAGLRICKAGDNVNLAAAALLDCYELCRQVGLGHGHRRGVTAARARSQAHAGPCALLTQRPGRREPGRGNGRQRPAPHSQPVATPPAALQAGVRIVSASYVGYYSALEEEAVEALAQAGILVSAAAGNCEPCCPCRACRACMGLLSRRGRRADTRAARSPRAPATTCPPTLLPPDGVDDGWWEARFPAHFGLDNILSVAATTPTDELASFSSYSRRAHHRWPPPPLSLPFTVPADLRSGRCSGACVCARALEQARSPGCVAAA